MSTDLETRLASLEATVGELQGQIEQERRRRRRAGTIRLVGLVLVVIAYVVMLQQATSLLGG